MTEHGMEQWKEALVRIMKERTGAEPCIKDIQGTVDRWVERMGSRVCREAPCEKLPIEFLMPQSPGAAVPRGLWSADHLRRISTSRRREDTESSDKSKWVGTHLYGSGQSPIDIPGPRVRLHHLPPLSFLELFRNGEVTVWNDGHTMKVKPTWRTFLTDGPIFCEYEFDQLHFHWSENSYSGTEHAINGNRYALEAHFVFKPYSCKGYRKSVKTKVYDYAVIGILFREEKSAPFYQVFSFCNQVVHENKKVIVPGNVMRDFQRALTGPEYYNYSGSLTTPPYTENINWTVMKEIQPILKTQVDAIRALQGHHGLIKNNVRPLQELGNRNILLRYR